MGLQKHMRLKRIKLLKQPNTYTFILLLSFLYNIKQTFNSGRITQGTRMKRGMTKTCTYKFRMVTTTWFDIFFTP